MENVRTQRSAKQPCEEFQYLAVILIMRLNSLFNTKKKHHDTDSFRFQVFTMMYREVGATVVTFFSVGSFFFLIDTKVANMILISVESTHEVNGMVEENITVAFTFQDSVINSFPNKLTSLYKDGNKKGCCKQTDKTNRSCSEKCVLSDVENSTVSLHITNLSLEDEGTYHVAVLADGENPLIESNKIHITVKLWNKTTGRFPLKSSVLYGFCSGKKLIMHYVLLPL